MMQNFLNQGNSPKKMNYTKGEAIIFDKDYYSYKNYQLGINTTQEQPYNNFLSKCNYGLN